MSDYSLHTCTVRSDYPCRGCQLEEKNREVLREGFKEVVKELRNLTVILETMRHEANARGLR